MNDPYRDVDLVPLYDVDNPGGADHDFYRSLAIDASRIVDLGCGTGLLTRSLVAPGRTVIGIDPSRTMLDWAKRQPGAEQVSWVLGTADAIAPTGDVDLIVCTGNAIMHLSPSDFSTALVKAAGALRSGGVLAFETRNPAVQEWRGWTPEATYGERVVHFGKLREWLEVTRADLIASEGLVEFDAHNVMPDGSVRTFRSHLWFRGEATITAALHAAGFGDVTIAGDFTGAALCDDSRLLVVSACAGQVP